MIKEIRRIVEDLNDPMVVNQQQLDRQLKLKELVVKHGVEAVSVAAGLKKDSLLAYLRSKRPTISEKAVSQAEYVFKMIAEA